MNKNLLLFALILFNIPSFAQTLSGFVREQKSGESLRDVNVSINKTRIGTSSNQYGFYSIRLKGNLEYEIVFSRVGYKPFSQKITLLNNQILHIDLEPSSTLLEEVAVSSERPTKESEKVEMSRISIPMQQFKEVPVILGEKDIIKTLQLLPGVQKGNEGTTGLYVRGGSPDQNLIILDDAVVYNANHLFGFFSTFNNDALKSVELIKGGFPARFGGRISSVLEMQIKEGSKEKFHGEGSLGIISSKLTVEGPIKYKLPISYLISARRTYADLIMPSSGDFPSIFFYDLNAKINLELNVKNRLYFSTYLGRDLSANSDKRSKSEDGFGWGNTTATLRWNRLISEKIFVNTSLVFSQYKFKVYNQRTLPEGDFLLEYSSKIRDFTFKTDFDAFVSPNFSMKFGGILTQHLFAPNAYVLKNPAKDTSGVRATEINALEGAIYIENTWKISNKLNTNFGVRVSGFSVGERTYINPELRFTATFLPAENWAIKTSYSQMNQYIHLLSNSGLGLPTDLWVPSTEKIAPQKSQQIAFGIVKDFTKSNISLTIEGYYKEMENILGYKQGANFLVLDFGANPNRINSVDWQENVTSGKGKAYGTEVFLQKKYGRIQGWMGYTLSWIKHQFPALNNGQEFYPKYDRRHDFSLVGIYKLRPRTTLSVTWVYGTGNNITIPIGSHFASKQSFSDVFGNGGVRVAELGEQNNFRAAPYHRLDVGFRFFKKKKKYERTWEISAYNLYNRINPFYYESRNQYKSSDYQLYRQGLFPIVPSISYHFKF
jgi:hypothetical protein